MRSLRVLWAGPVPPSGGGVAQHGARVVAALAALGHDVRVEPWMARRVRNAAQARIRAVRIRRWMDTVPAPDVVVIPWVSPVQAAAFTVLLDCVAAPVVGVVHNARPHEAQLGDAEITRAVLGRLTGLVVHSEAVAAEVAALGVGRPVAVVAHPPNLDLVPTPLPPPPLSLLFFGTIRPYKGVEAAAAAVAADGRWHLTVAGEPWISVDDLSGPRVHVDAGYVPDVDVPALFARHHAVVVPYLTASQSGVVPLALAAGRPVLATDAGGLAEQVRDGVDGVVVAGAGWEALARGLERLTAGLPGLAAEAARCPVPAWRDVGLAVVDAMGA